MFFLINGAVFRDAIISAANNIDKHKTEVDSLNVFPVPDGDTGTNMAMTLSAAAREVSLLDDSCDIQAVSECVASALLRGARGNSGVITSLIFRGISHGFKGKTEADGVTLASALSNGVSAAYKAVMKPTEGTILTVVREAAQQANAACKSENEPVKVFAAAFSSAKDALAKTPDMLPVLKKAGVVDAGGQGLVFIFEGMLSVFENGKIVDGSTSATAEKPKTAVAAADDDIEFGYCTEFLIEKDKEQPKDASKLRKYYESFGDCVVVVDDDDIIKVHCHSNTPDKVIKMALTYGSLINIKIDNMRRQHSNARGGAMDTEKKEETVGAKKKKSAPKEKKYGFVAVCNGEGIAELFKEIGADTVVFGGQTMNPSTEDILEAVESVPAEYVFVLPNNKNIIMASEQATNLATREVGVLQDRTIAQGISALLNFDENLSPDENLMNMTKAIENVHTALVTFAARNSSIDDRIIKKGEMLGMEDGKITCSEQDAVTAGYKAAKGLIRKYDASMVTIFYGDNTTENEAAVLQQMLMTKFPTAEVGVVNGGQPIYNFIISVE